MFYMKMFHLPVFIFFPANLIEKIFADYCSHYYSFALELITQDKMHPQFYEYTRFQCIEIAIWPLLYIHKKWCESNISEQV